MPMILQPETDTLPPRDCDSFENYGSQAPEDRSPLRTMLLHTSMEVGGAEIITANLVRRLPPERFLPEIVCLKSPGTLGAILAAEFPVHSGILAHKYDARVPFRLAQLFRRRGTDVVITVGAGDKMFWGRLAARIAKVPVVISAIHSTGWPDSIGRLNRCLTPYTDAFIAVAESHRRYLIDREGLPASKLMVVPNGVDTGHFAPRHDRRAIRERIGIDDATPVVILVAALRPEKNHELFIETARRVAREIPSVRFLVVGDGPCRPHLEHLANESGATKNVLFLGSRGDVAELLAASDLFLLTSKVEANPVSILEAMSTALPVVATRVGSIPDVIADGNTGYLVPCENPEEMAKRVISLLRNPGQSLRMGIAGRRTVVENWSIERMISGYANLMENIYERKLSARRLESRKPNT